MPRLLRFEVRERVDAAGNVLRPLEKSDLDHVIARCREEGVEAIAIQFLHSYVAPRHEAETAAYLRERLDGVSITASHEITREWREYERANTAVLNAYVQPIVQSYFGRLEEALSGADIRCAYAAMQSNGGTTSFAWAKEHPITLMESGPAAGCNGAAIVADLCDEPRVIYLDIGGTTAKCTTIEDGAPKVTTEYRLEYSRSQFGYPLRVPVVDIVEIGAGGGSIAWFDRAGLLKVGPVSAGADPGPACYGRGGTKPTVTDAKLITGVINPHQLRRRAVRPRRGSGPHRDGDDRERAWHGRGGGGRRRHPHGGSKHDQRAEAGLDPARPRPARLRAGGGRRRRAHARRPARPRARREGDRRAALSRALLRLGDAGHRAPARLHADGAAARRGGGGRRRARGLRRPQAGGGALLPHRRPHGGSGDRLRGTHRPALSRPGALGHRARGHRGRARGRDPRRLPRRAREDLHLPPRRHRRWSS